VQGKLQLGGMRTMFGTWMRRVAFGVAFFVNAEGEKEDTVVIGTSICLRCLKNLQSPSWPYSCSYFTNSKV